MSDVIPRLETTRLRLRPFQPSDSDTVARLAGAAEVAATTATIPHPYPPGAAEEWIRGHEPAAAAGTSFTWAIERKVDNALIGAVSLMINERQRRGAFGYWMGVPFWNQGYMTETVSAVLAVGFGQRDLYRIEIMMLPRNIGSSRVAEKVGMEREGKLRGWVLKDGVFEDVLIYGLLRPDFEGRGAR